MKIMSKMKISFLSNVIHVVNCDFPFDKTGQVCSDDSCYITGTAGKQSHSTVHPSSGNQPSGPIGPSQTGNILERALQPGGHSSQSATTSSSLQHTAIQTKKKIKR